MLLHFWLFLSHAEAHLTALLFVFSLSTSLSKHTQACWMMALWDSLGRIFDSGFSDNRIWSMLAIDSGFVVKEKEYVILLLYVNTADICDRSYNLYSCCCHWGDSGFYDWNNRQQGGTNPLKLGYLRGAVVSFTLQQAIRVVWEKQELHSLTFFL